MLIKCARYGAYIIINRKVQKMQVLEYVLIAVLIIAAFVIIGVVLFQKSADEGLSGTIAGGADTFYGKDKSAHTDRTLYKWTIIAGIVFAAAVFAVYVLQPDYSNGFDLDAWMTTSGLNSYTHVFPE